MKILSWLALIILPLVGYSAGTAARASKVHDLKPRGGDLVLVVLIWAGAILSRENWSLNRWLLVLVWILLAALIGYLAGVWRKETEPLKKRRPEAKEVPSAALRRFWAGWKDFSSRMGGFQSRILLSFFYFIIVSPFALAVRIFSDPLRLKHRPAESFWMKKQEAEPDLEEFRRQF